MKKTRNTFFQESYQSYNPNMTMQQPAPYQTASNFYYQGPIPTNYNTFSNGIDIESRIAKIERQINRIDYRLSKLENTNNTMSSEDFDTNNSNMYML